MPENNFKLLTYEELAEKLNLHPVTLRQWVSDNRIPCTRLGRSVRFSSENVDQIIQNGPKKLRRKAS